MTLLAFALVYRAVEVFVVDGGYPLEDALVADACAGDKRAGVHLTRACLTGDAYGDGGGHALRKILPSA